MHPLLPPQDGSSLLIGLGGRSALEPIIRNTTDRPIVALVKPSELESWVGIPTITVNFRADARDLHFRERCISPDFLAYLRGLGFSSVIVPSVMPITWRDNALEVLASKIADTVELISIDGIHRRAYSGESLHRLIYNKAYLASMLSVTPNPAKVERVLEVGCSDGLACDLLVQLGAKKVFGVDLWTENVGSEYASAYTEFSRADATHLKYPDQYFDLSYSIATFEHLQDPWSVLAEMFRVTKIGGYVFVQAGPLYHSPFGHHMFKYFSDEPWAHLRFTANELSEKIHSSGLSEHLMSETGLTPEIYVDRMLSADHINGLFLSEYHLEAFSQELNVETLKYSISHEGKNLLTPELLVELKRFPPNTLIEHGFEFCLRRL